MKKILTTTLVLILSTSANGFMNIESLRADQKLGFKGSVNAKVNGQSGNSEKFIGSLGHLLAYKTDLDETLISLTYSYGESFHRKDTNNGSFHLRRTRALSPFWSVEAYAQAEFNEFKALNLRQLFGAGFRNLLFNSEISNLWFGLGGFYEIENLKDELDQEGFRLNFYVSQIYNVTEKLQSAFTLYVQPATKDISDLKNFISLSIDFHLTKNLSALMDVQYQYDSAPPERIKNTDILYLTGLGYEF